MTSLVKTQHETWLEISASLIDELTILLPERLFAPFVTKEQKLTIAEMNPETGKRIGFVLVYRDEKNTIGNFKAFKNKKDQFLMRVASNNTAQKFGLHRDGGWAGQLFPYSSLASFDEVSDNNSLTFIVTKALDVFQQVQRIPGLHFSLNHSANTFSCSNDGFDFILNYFFTPEHAQFFLSSNNSSSNAPFTFNVPFDQFNILHQILSQKINEFRLMQLFDSKKTSFFEIAVYQNVFSVFDKLPLFYPKLISFLKSETGFSQKEIEALFLTTPNSHKNKNFICVGNYRISRYGHSPHTKSALLFNMKTGEAQTKHDDFWDTADDEISVFLLDFNLNHLKNQNS